jgi:hypothetical protein
VIVKLVSLRSCNSDWLKLTVNHPPLGVHPDRIMCSVLHNCLQLLPHSVMNSLLVRPVPHRSAYFFHYEVVSVHSKSQVEISVTLE